MAAMPDVSRSTTAQPAEQAGHHSSTDMPLAAKLAAARRNGVVFYEDRFGSKFWFRQPSRSELGSPDVNSYGTEQAAAKLPAASAATRSAAAPRHRPPSYRRRLADRLARRQGTTSSTISTEEATGNLNGTPSQQQQQQQQQQQHAGQQHELQPSQQSSTAPDAHITVRADKRALDDDCNPASKQQQCRQQHAPYTRRRHSSC